MYSWPIVATTSMLCEQKPLNRLNRCSTAVTPRFQCPRLETVMADAWKKLRSEVKDKRLAKCNQRTSTKQRPKGEELIVQRLSSEVSGKAQKYCRIGPREFVPFGEAEEFTVENIKRACEKHFAHLVGKRSTCDVLAGDQGPSCKTVSQIPDFKVIYVRFIPSSTAASSTTRNKTEFAERKRQALTEPCSSRVSELEPLPATSHSSPSKLFSHTQKKSMRYRG